MTGISLSLCWLVTFSLTPRAEGAGLVGDAGEQEAQQFDAFVPVSQRSWNYNVYNRNKGPHNWMNIPGPGFSTCAGKNQSPINIVTKDVTTNFFLDVSFHYPRSPLFGKLKNRGKAPYFLVPEWERRWRISNVPNRPGQTYILADIHAHFHADPNIGSEHTIDGEGYDTELHLVHYNSRYARNISLANSAPDGLAVVAVFLKGHKTQMFASQCPNGMNRRNNVGYQRCCSHTHSHSYATGPLTSFIINNFGRIMNAGATRYGWFPDLNDVAARDKWIYSYDGSLTTRPCYESVAWIVKRDPIEITPQALRILRRMESSRNELVIKYGNTRPKQDRNNRPVEANFFPLMHTMLKTEAMAEPQNHIFDNYFY